MEDVEVDQALASEPNPGSPREPEGARSFLHVEQQVILRLPETGAVVFSINTWLTHQ